MECTGLRILGRKETVKLLRLIEEANSNDVQALLQTFPSYSVRVLENGSTALHVAIIAGKIELAKKLISEMSYVELKIQDKSGKTALSLAASKGSREIVKSLVEREGELLKIPDFEGKIPVVLACANNHKSLTLDLYSQTVTTTILDHGDHLFFLFRECLRNRMLDFGLEILRQHQALIFPERSLQPTPIISELVEMLSPLFAWWEQPFLSRKLIMVHDLIMVNDRDRAREMVRFVCSEKLSTLGREQLTRSGAVEATFKAIKLGYLDFVKQITKTNPDIVWINDPEHSRDMLMYAVAHRQREIAEFLYGLNVWRNITEFTTDDKQNNMLHLAAELSPSSPFTHRSPGPVSHMHSDAAWFKAVRKIVPTFYEGQKNRDGKTPLEVFRREHQNLLEEAERWVKGSANFAAIIGTLIVGITFAACITVPGGNNDRDGLPNFSKRVDFTLFMVLDLIFLFLAAISVLLFLDIHSSCLTEESFLNGLFDWKLIFANCFLFSSIVGMLLCGLYASVLVGGHYTYPWYIIIIFLILILGIHLYALAWLAPIDVIGAGPSFSRNPC